MIAILLILLSIAMVAIVVYAAYITYDYRKKIEEIYEVLDEIKAKIGAVVREFNINARQDYEVNQSQQNEIEKIKNDLKAN